MATHDQTLRDVVAAHDKFYTSLVETGSAQLPETAWSFINEQWAPWHQQWLDSTADGDPLSPSFIQLASKSLSELRERAREAGAPVPELSPYAPPAAHLAHLAHLGFPHAPVNSPDGADVPIPLQIERETDRRFRDATGWPVGRKIDPHREPAMLRRWLQIRYQVAQEFAAQR